MQVLLFAHAATKQLQAGIDPFQDGESFVNAMKNVSFTGIERVKVELDSHGDRQEDYSIQNYVANENDSGRLHGVEVATYRSINQSLELHRLVRWPDNFVVVAYTVMSYIVMAYSYCLYSYGL